MARRRIRPCHARRPAAPLTLKASNTAPTAAIDPSAALAGTPGQGKLDVVFPILHGTFGEDGTIQGLLELADVPYVGSGVLGSAAGMDKDVMKKLFAAAQLPQTPWLALTRTEWRANPKAILRQIEKSLRYPLFVKPANLGSSVGISKVKTRAGLTPALDLAARFDRKLVVEQGVGGPGAKPRELEVAVLGNDFPEASIVGEIVPAKEFYDYEAKYQLSGPDESVSILPAKLTAAQQKRIRAMAITAFKACDASGLARVDFLMEPSEPGQNPHIFLNRNQHHAWLHPHLHVPQALGRNRPPLPRAHRPPHRPRARAQPGETSHRLHPRLSRNPAQSHAERSRAPVSGLRTFSFIFAAGRRELLRPTTFGANPSHKLPDFASTFNSNHINVPIKFT